MRTFSLITVFLFYPLAGAFAQSGALETELLNCAARTQEADRLACFDELTQTLSGKPAVKSTNTETPENIENVAKTDSSENQADENNTTLPDSIGGGAFAEAAGEVKKSYRGHVTSCKKSADRRWFYIFDNGQVWKQVDRRKRRHRSCDFKVTLNEDSFGYVMKIDDEKGTIRVSRRR